MLPTLTQTGFLVATRRTPPDDLAGDGGPPGGRWTIMPLTGRRLMSPGSADRSTTDALVAEKPPERLSPSTMGRRWRTAMVSRVGMGAALQRGREWAGCQPAAAGAALVEHVGPFEAVVAGVEEPFEVGGDLGEVIVMSMRPTSRAVVWLRSMPSHGVVELCVVGFRPVLMRCGDWRRGCRGGR